MPVPLETAATERDPITVAKMCYQAYVDKIGLRSKRSLQTSSGSPAHWTITSIERRI